MGCTTSTASTCKGSQPAREDLVKFLEPRGGQISSSGTLLGARSRSAAYRQDSVEKPQRPATCHDVTIHLYGVQNLRPASGRKGRSDLFLHVAVEGSPEAQVTTPRVEGVAQAAGHKKQSASLTVDFNTEVQLRGWRSDRRIFFSVRGGVGNRLLAQAYLSPDGIYDGFHGDIPFTNSVEGTRGTMKAKVSVSDEVSDCKNVDMLKKWGCVDKPCQHFINPHQRQQPADEDMVFATISTQDTLYGYSEFPENEDLDDVFEDDENEISEDFLRDSKVATSIRVAV